MRGKLLIMSLGSQGCLHKGVPKNKSLVVEIKWEIYFIFQVNIFQSFMLHANMNIFMVN